MLEEKLPTRLRYQISGLCSECGGELVDDSCRRCLDMAAERVRRLRAKRKKQRRCYDCGKRSKSVRCKGCKQPVVTKPKRVVTEPNHATTDQHGGFRTVTEVDGRYAEGRTRERYVGRGSRGAPSRQQLEAEDERTLRIAAREMLRAADLVAEANQIPESMPRIQRVAQRREALSPAIPAARLALAVLRRNGAIDDEAEDTEDDG